MGDLGISTRPRSTASLPDSTASTGLQCLLVGAHVHHGRSDIKVDSVATTACISHSVHDIYIYIYIFIYTYICIYMQFSLNVGPVLLWHDDFF